MKKLGNIGFGNRFYLLGAGVALGFALSFIFAWLFLPMQVVLAVFIAFVGTDLMILLASRIEIQGSRKLPSVCSLGNHQTVELNLLNRSAMHLKAIIYDDLPAQLQLRDVSFETELKPAISKRLQYIIRPTTRGVYRFGRINCLVFTRMALVNLKVISGEVSEVAVYPSIIDMKNIALSAFQTQVLSGGIRKIRRIGHSYSFEQIKEYVQGDEFRSINWKATGRRGKLMVNQYEDERSQQIYSVIDQSRVMQMPFEGLSLLDYAVNSSLALSNVALRKHDKAGLIHFSGKTAKVIPAERSLSQMRRLLDSLYSLKSMNSESSFELLYTHVRARVSQRSLMFVYTNFESSYALERAMPMLIRLHRLHLLVVVFFENTEVSKILQESPKSLEEIYLKAVAEKHLTTKMQLVQTLRQQGIQTIYTRPQDLSVQTVNKYLELKARGLI